MTRKTQDISIYDETSDSSVAVDVSSRLSTKIDNTVGEPVPIGDAGGSITIDATSLPLPTGAATEATLATRASETTLSAINGKLVNGNDIGDVTINNAAGASAVNIQDGGNSITVDGTVAVSSVVPGTGATNLGKAEDAAHASGHVGVMALAVRNDAHTSLAGTTGDYLPATTDQDGNVWVNNRKRQLVNELTSYANTGTRTVYTVPTGKVLYIQTLGMFFGDESSGIMVGFWRNNTTNIAPSRVGDDNPVCFLQYSAEAPLGPYSAGTTINFNRTSGDNDTYALQMTGYLEDS